jgi:hypothetical protein
MCQPRGVDEILIVPFRDWTEGNSRLPVMEVALVVPLKAGIAGSEYLSP